MIYVIKFQNCSKSQQLFNNRSQNIKMQQKKKKRINKLTPTSRQLLSHMINVEFFFLSQHAFVQGRLFPVLEIAGFQIRPGCRRPFMYALIDHPNQFLWSTQIWWGPFVLTPPNVDKTPRNS